MDALVIEKVCKTFGCVQAVDNLDLRVPGGCIYGFLGPNGAGKTTTLRMIMNILYPDSGKIEILGSSDVARAKGSMGYMPEERGLYQKMTVGDVLNYLGALKGIKKRERAERIAKWLSLFSLADRAGKKVEELSKGMQQKLQFIAAVIHDPQILILDEPFSGLDPVNLELIRNLMIKMRDEGKTVIFSTHMMEHAQALCDFILLINKGAKILDGTLDDIRAEFKTDSVCLEVEGDAGFIAGLPMVKDVVTNGRRLEVRLNSESSDQDLLKMIVGKVRIRSFEVKTPSLHEIFIQRVGQSNA